MKGQNETFTNAETTNSSSEFGWEDGIIIGAVDAEMPNTTIYDSRNSKNRYNSKNQVANMTIIGGTKYFLTN